MTYIKTLEMQGFKSFAHKTRITFPRTLAVIIGPNGSGKSNLVDALFFVLGKTSKKDMRAEKLGHLVYNGGKHGKPAKFAKVSITLDNKDRELPVNTDEVIISRSVNRDGNSIYALNGKRVTRAEIQNVLSHANIKPDGFNLLMQGEIARFVEMHPEERKQIIYEISGIASFEEKKHKASLELKHVENKLKEASIVLKERENYLNGLLKEKTQAEKYLKLTRKLERVKASLLHKQKEEEIKKKNKLLSELRTHEEEVKKLESAIAKSEEYVKNTQEELKKTELEIKKRGRNEQQKLLKEIDKIKEELINAEQLIKSHEHEIKRINYRQEQIKKTIKENEEKIKELRSKEKQLEEKINKLKQSITKNNEFLKKTEPSADLIKLKTRLIELKNRVKEKQEELNEVKKALEKKEELTNLQKELMNNEKKIKGLEERIKKQEALRKKAQEKLDEVKEFLSETRARLTLVIEKEKLVKDLLQDGVKEILKLRDQGLKGVYGTIAELAITPKEYVRALKIASREDLNTVIVDTKETAIKCVQHLKRVGKPGARFLILDQIKEVKTKKISNDEAILASELVRTKPELRKAFNWVFRNAFITPDNRTAERISNEGIKAVSLEGLFIQPPVMGYGTQLRMSFKSTQEASKEELKQTIKEYEEYSEKLVNHLKELSDKIIALENDKKVLTRRSVELKHKIKLLSDEVSCVGDARELEKEIERLTKKQREVEMMLVERKNALSEEERKELIDKIKDAEARYQSLVIEKNTLTAQVNNVLLKENHNLTSIQEELRKQEKEFKELIKKRKEEIKELRRKSLDKKKEERKFRAALKDFIKQKNKLKKIISDTTYRVLDLKRRKDRAEKDAQETSVKIAEVNARITSFEERLRGYANVEVIKNKSVEKLEEETRELEFKIRSFGPVNMKALQTYNEVSKHYAKLKEKYVKLEEEHRKVLSTIQQIEGKKRYVFMQTFTNISNNFSRIFAEISPGGEAKLQLENPENPLEGGVNIIAKPAGKKMTSLSALSGGEKTLVTLAFIFAIQEYEPAPFYFFDEIDAALDKSNSEKLANLIKKYSSKAQFILISHNDEMVSVSDYLYGVSMKENAVSQVISIKLPERKDEEVMKQLEKQVET